MERSRNELPRWHVKQRRVTYEEIVQRLEHPNIHYVPLARMRLRDADFHRVARVVGLERGGAHQWRLARSSLSGRRRRPIHRSRAGLSKSAHLLVQSLSRNCLRWARSCVSRPSTTVVGGGLASIDVVKVLQIEMTLQALKRRGIDEDMLKLEREGVEPVLKTHGLAYGDLGVAPCRLFYRRRVLDMPLSDIAPDATPKRAEAMRQARAKILDKAQRKFLFEFQELSVPTGLVVEGDRMVGVMMSRTEAADGKVRTIPDSGQPVRAPMTISSIGSIPEPIPGIPQRGEVYTYVDAQVGLLMEGRTAIYASGYVLTGKGNLKDSLVSGTEIGIHVAERYPGSGRRRSWFSRWPRPDAKKAHDGRPAVGRQASTRANRFRRPK